MEKIELYTTGCPQCQILEKKLDLKGIPYIKVTDFKTEELTSKGIYSAPVLKIGENYMAFKDAIKWVNER